MSISEIRAQKRRNDLIKKHMWAIRNYEAKNRTRLHWIPSDELRGLLLNALWRGLEDAEKADETDNFYLYFWNRARQETAKHYRQYAKERGRTRSNLYSKDFKDVSHHSDWMEQLFSNEDPMVGAMMLERLERLPERHQEMLGLLAGAGEQAYAAMAETLKLLNQQQVIREMGKVKDVVQDDFVPRGELRRLKRSPACSPEPASTPPIERVDIGRDALVSRMAAPSNLYSEIPASSLQTSQ